MEDEWDTEFDLVLGFTRNIMFLFAVAGLFTGPFHILVANVYDVDIFVSDVYGHVFIVVI